MKNLSIIKHQGINVTDSREVAGIISKKHSHLMRDIKGYKEIMDQNPKLDSANFFIESEYEATTGQKYPCYLLTKQGCEMVANKMTGEKGILFTATYVQAFNQMEDRIKNNQQELPKDFLSALKSLVASEEEKQNLQLESAQQKQIINELQPKATYYDLILQNTSLLSVTLIAKDYGMSGTALNKKLHELGVQYLQSQTWLLYAKYQDKGYTSSKTQNYVRTDGTQGSKLHTYWTQKGRLFIYDLLKQQGILPIIEREVA